MWSRSSPAGKIRRMKSRNVVVLVGLWTISCITGCLAARTSPAHDMKELVSSYRDRLNRPPDHVLLRDDTGHILDGKRARLHLGTKFFQDLGANDRRCVSCRDVERSFPGQAVVRELQTETINVTAIHAKGKPLTLAQRRSIRQFIFALASAQVFDQQAVGLPSLHLPHQDHSRDRTAH